MSPQAELDYAFRNSVTQRRNQQPNGSKASQDRKTAETQLPVPLVAATAVAMGLLFGVAFSKSYVYAPESVRAQMLFRNFISAFMPTIKRVLKTFFGALAMSFLVFAVLSMAAPRRFALSRTSSDTAYIGVKSTVFGAFLLGTGMTVAGTCPGMMLAQVGSGVENAAWVFAGALLSALVFSWSGFGKVPCCYTTTKEKTPFVDERTKIPYHRIGFPAAAGLFAVLALLEFAIPWQGELPKAFQERLKTASTLFEMPAWPPSLSGMIIGLLQIPAILIMNGSVGCSSAYCTMVSAATGCKTSYGSKFANGIRNWWKVFFVVSAIFGALFSSQMSGTFGDASGVSVPMAIAGAFIMIWGARYADGCTSGHGISGFSMLNLNSLIAMPVMFAGGILSAVMLHLLGLY